MTLAGAAGHGLPLRLGATTMDPLPFLALYILTVLAFALVLAGILPAGEPSE